MLALNLHLKWRDDFNSEIRKRGYIDTEPIFFFLTLCKKVNLDIQYWLQLNNERQGLQYISSLKR